MSQRRITRVPGQHHAKTVLTALADRTIGPALILRDAPGRRMRDSFQQRYALRLIRLTESFAQAKRQRLKSSQQVSPQRYHLGNVDGLRLDPSIYGRSQIDP